jgi:hypothetical protein
MDERVIPHKRNPHRSTEYPPVANPPSSPGARGFQPMWACDSAGPVPPASDARTQRLAPAAKYVETRVDRSQRVPLRSLCGKRPGCRRRSPRRVPARPRLEGREPALRRGVRRPAAARAAGRRATGRGRFHRAACDGAVLLDQHVVREERNDVLEGTCRTRSSGRSSALRPTHRGPAGPWGRPERGETLPSARACA